MQRKHGILSLQRKHNIPHCKGNNLKNISFHWCSSQRFV
jgi:hypothetical protein